MTIITLLGIDPGAITTGAVAIILDSERKSHAFSVEALPGDDSQAVAEWCRAFTWAENPQAQPLHAFGERYRNRGTHTHQGMSKLEGEIRALVPWIKWIDNTGMKKVVTRELLELLGLWTFSVKSHHQDLRAAARIALFGALKDPELNRVVYDVVTTILDRRSSQRPTRADYERHYREHPEDLGEHDPTL